MSRVWDYQHKEKPDICIDEFSLIPAGEIGFDVSWIDQTYETSKSSLYLSEQYDKQRIQYRFNVDGTLYSDKIYYWMRNAYTPNASHNTHINSYGAVSSSESYRNLGCSPLALIG